MHTSQNFISHLEQQLQKPLPGITAQFKMAATDRPIMHMPIREDVRSAAVLLTLFIKNGKWHTILMKRKSHPKDRHSGQISFPGGKQEVGEKLSFTALRESHEEVGTPTELQLLGPLTQLHIPISNFMVHPFVAFLDQNVQLRPQITEVDQIFEVPLDALFDPNTRKNTDLRAPEGLLLKNVPYFNIQNQLVWGATAMILNEFIAVCEKIDLTS